MNSDKELLGRSLKVPSVQDLVNQKPGSVPERYIRPDQDPPFISHSSSLQKLPVIDMERLLSGDDQLNLELQKLDSACREWGFFQLINHGVTSSLMEKVKQGIQEFFKLPKEEKEKFAQKPGDIEGLGQAFVMSEEQKLDWADMLFATTQPPHFRKPHLFPKFPLPFSSPSMETSPETVNFGRSLIIPSVQELAKEPIGKIPPQYARHDQESPLVSDVHSLPMIPIIDLQNLLAGKSMDSELERLHLACKDWGFFQVVNHGVSDLLLEDLRREIVGFFELPFGEKKKLWQQPDNHEGFGQLFVVSDDQKLDWSDMFYITTLPTSLRKMELFEKLPPKLRETLSTYSLEVKNLAMILLSKMAQSLRIDVKEMKALFSKGVQSMRMNYYPPCPEPEMAIGFSPHSDADALTILYQLNETEGLQIRKDGEWVPVKPLQNALVVNIGDIMEIITNGEYHSIEHRAIVTCDKERLSVATFYSSNLDSELGPAPTLIGPHNPAVFRRMPVEEYFKEFFARKLRGKSYLDFMKIESGDI